MDEKRLTALLTAVRVGSISRAAEELGYTQSGLTQMMNALESELGCRLLERDYSGVRLTETGARLFPYAREAAEALRRLRAEAARTGDTAQTPVRIGAFPSIAKVWLPRIIKSFQRENPDVPIDLLVGGYDIRGWLADGSIDLAFSDESLCGGARWLPLIEDRFLAAVPADCRLSGRSTVTVRELAEYPFILSQINELKVFVSTWMGSHLRETVHINAVDDTSLVSLVEQGLGVTILPELSLAGHSQQVWVLALEPPMKRTLGAVIPKTLRGSAAAFEAFLARLPQIIK